MLRRQIQIQALEIHDIVKAELALIDDTEILNQELQRMSSERAGYRDTISRLERENAFLLEERDLLSQQLASEARNIGPAQRQHSTCSLTPLHFIPFATPKPFNNLDAAEGDPLGGCRPGEGMGLREESAPNTPPYASSPHHNTPFSGVQRASEQPAETRREVLLAELRERYSHPYSGRMANGTPGQHCITASPGSDDSTPLPFVRHSADARCGSTFHAFTQSAESARSSHYESSSGISTPFHTPPLRSIDSPTPASWRRAATASPSSEPSENEPGVPQQSDSTSQTAAATPFHSPATAFTFSAGTCSPFRWNYASKQQQDPVREKLDFSDEQLSPRGSSTLVSACPSASHSLSRLSAAEVPFVHPDRRSTAHSDDTTRTRSQNDLQLTALRGDNGSSPEL